MGLSLIVEKSFLVNSVSKSVFDNLRHYIEVKVLKIGAIVLTIDAVFNFLLAAGILIAIIFFGKNPPILYVSLGEIDIARLDKPVLTAFKSLAVYFNSAVVTFCILSIFVIWMGLAQEQRWAFWALLITMGTGRILGFVADSLIGNKTLGVNIILTVVYLFGIGLSWYGLRVK
jgi:hypothetical protein